MATCMIKQRSILGSSFAAGVPNTFRNKVLRSPLSHFDVTPHEVLEQVKSQYENFIQNRAFTTAIARLGNVNVSKFKSAKKTVRNKVTVLSRGVGRGQFFRGAGMTRGNRGMPRGALRGVRKTSNFNLTKNMRGYARRDRAIRDSESHPRGRASTSGAGFSGENRL